MVVGVVAAFVGGVVCVAVGGGAVVGLVVGVVAAFVGGVVCVAVVCVAVVCVAVVSALLGSVADVCARRRHEGEVDGDVGPHVVVGSTFRVVVGATDTIGLIRRLIGPVSAGADRDLARNHDDAVGNAVVVVVQVVVRVL